MVTISSAATPLHLLDRKTYVNWRVEKSQGRQTIEEVTKQVADSDLHRLKMAATHERILAGEGLYLGSSIGNKRVWNPEHQQRNIEQARQRREAQYLLHEGPIRVEALNIDAVLDAQSQLGESERHTISWYAESLRNQVALASRAKGDASFIGAWGNDRVTNDVNEYIGWLTQAAKVAAVPERKAPPLRDIDRVGYAQMISSTSPGKPSVEQVIEWEEQSDLMRLSAAQIAESFLSGKGRYAATVRGLHKLGGSEADQRAIDQAREKRVERYSYHPGLVTIDALDVEHAVKAQATLTKGDLSGLAVYGNYLRNELAAATKAKGDAFFFGTWGRDRSTHDVDEYIGWLFDAVRLKKSRTPDVLAGLPRVNASDPGS